MDLRVAGIGKKRAAFVGAEGRGDIATARVRRKVEHIPVAAGAEEHRIGRMGRDFTRLEIANDDSLRMAIHHDEIEHFGFREHLHRATRDLMAQTRIGTEEELLPGLAASVKSAGNLRAAEGAVVEETAVFAGEGNALRDALVDDRGAHLGETMDIGLAGAEVAAFDRVVEKPVNAVTVVLVVLRGIDATLRGDRVGAARAVLVAEALHIVALLGQRRSGRGTGEAGTHDDQIKLSLIRRADDFRVVLEGGPFLVEGTGWNFAIECHCRTPFPRPKK